MNKIKIFSLIAVFTSLFVGFEKLNAQDVSKPQIRNLPQKMI